MNKIYKKIILCTLVLIMFVFIAIVIKRYFTPFLFILILSVFCAPLTSCLDKIILNRKISSFISLILINLFMIVLLSYLGNSMYGYIYNFEIKNYEGLKKVIDEITEYFNVIFKMFDLNMDSLSTLGKSYIRKGAFYTTEWLIAYFVANMCTYFILSGKYDILNFIKLTVGKDIYNNLYDRFMKIKNLLIIEIKMVFLSTIIIMIGFIFLRIPNALILSIICGVLDILPYVGTIIVFFPLLLYNIVMKNYFTAIGLSLLYVLGEIIRQILETKFISGKLEIHPLVVLVAIYIGIKSLGVVGLFAGPLYVIAAKDILLSE